ncbi:NAD-dependent epimerase/dehydratase family protein [Marivita sp.]|uniref:NAD-dependent epimerase/dehydratase family protein n=1 Tax=Marivita sp. TaxID=2003365 RepID=UPI003F70E933
MPSRIVIVGGDGFCGWPTALHHSRLGHEVTILDNLSRRAIDEELGAQSLTPICSIEDRIDAWKEVTGNSIEFLNVDVSKDYDLFFSVLKEKQPKTLIHFGEQRAAPYSMKDPTRKRYTVDNNIGATHNILVALSHLATDVHLVHLGTMGVYGYDEAGIEIPEGYLTIFLKDGEGNMIERQILYPSQPGSVYHMTKVMDQRMFQYYAKNDNMRITDLHQGIVWGTQTEETRLDDRLINRFDYDGDYGTVLNRFLMQAASDLPLTVHGTGGQTRAFINIQDTVKSVALAVDNPPARGDKVKIMNQMTETHRVRDLAKIVSDITGSKIALVRNPRKEAIENNLSVSNKTLLGMGLNPITLAEGLLEETVEIATRYFDRVRTDTVAATAVWTADQRPGIVTEAALDRGKSIQ